MSFDPISAIFEVGGKLIDKLLPDPTAKAEAIQKLAELKASGELATMANETTAFTAEQVGVTDRWKADMSADSWLSKNIRPMALIFVTITTTMFAVASAFNYKIDLAYITLFGQLLLLMFGAYFGGRSLEKIMSVYVNRK